MRSTNDITAKAQSLGHSGATVIPRWTLGSGPGPSTCPLWETVSCAFTVYEYSTVQGDLHLLPTSAMNW